MNCTRHELRHCDRERMRKRDTSPLTSGPDRPAGPTRTTALQEILHCDLCAGISKTAALSASQLAAHLSLLHNTGCACRHRSRIGQVHRLPSGSDSHCVVREATLLTPLCARLHKNFHPHHIVLSPSLPKLWAEENQEPQRIRVRSINQPLTHQTIQISRWSSMNSSNSTTVNPSTMVTTKNTLNRHTAHT
jgi:hypothetical protein